MEQVKFYSRLAGSPGRWRNFYVARVVLALLVGLWLSLIPHQQLAAQCPAESFVPPLSVFNPFSASILVFAQDPDGKFLVGGVFGTEGLARLNSDGSIDDTFIPPDFNYPAQMGIREVVRLPDGDYMVGGYFDKVNGAAYNYVVRLNSDGSVDDSFTPPPMSAPSGIEVYVTSIVPLSDGKFLVGGTFWQPKANVVRLNADGTFDSTFGFDAQPGPDGPRQPLGIAYDLIVQPDGKILVGTQFGIQRLNADGTKDRTTFTNPLYAPNNIITSVELLSDGKILAGGSFSSPTNRIVKLNSDGSVDQSFNPPSSLSLNVWDILAQADGKIVIGGNFTERVMRLNADGSQDNTLDIPPISGGNFAQVRDLQLSPGGYYIAAGIFGGAFGGGPRNCIAYLCKSDIVIGSFSCNDNDCGGSGATISYTSDATHGANNTFTVQLSDGGGNFANPTIVGTLSSSASSGNISITFPPGLAYGSGYRLRVVSTSPALTGSNNGTDIELGARTATLVAGTPSEECDGTVNIAVFAQGPYDRYTWTWSESGINYNYWTTDPEQSSLSVTSNGTYTFTGTMNGFSFTDSISIVSINPCCTAPTNAGAIAGTQLICPNTAAFTLPSALDANMGVGELEYRWQQSTTGPNSGFSDIPNSNSNTYAPGVLSTTTWFRRLAGVSCLTDWTLAPASNVIQVTVQDLVQPAIGCPSNQSVILNASCSASLPNYIESALTIDNCAVLNVTQSPAAGTIVAGAGSMQVTLTVNDVNGNSNSCQFSVTKVDNTPPAISCLPHSIVFNGQADINLNVNDMASASDNCGLQSVVTSIPAISCAQLGQAVPVTVTATDNSGNTASCISMVTVQGLPCGWRQLPGGVNCANGNQVTYNTANQVFTVNSTNCHTPMAPHVADGFAFAQRTLCGNGSLQALVTDVNGLGWAGISMRESNAAGAKKVHLLTNRQFYHRREVRNANNAQVIPQTWLGFDRYWLRLVRTGTDIVGFISPNGNQWVQVLVAKVNMNSCIEIGLLTHHSNTTGNMTATFSNVAVTGNTTYYLQEQNNPGTTTPDAAQAAINQGAVYPNPSTGEIFVDLTSFAVEEMQLEVYDQLGRQLQSLQLSPMDMPWQRVDLSNLPAGVYFVKLSAAGYPQQTERVLIQRP